MAEILTKPTFSLFESKADSRFQLRHICSGSTGEELKRIGFDESYRETARKKFRHLIIKASALSAPGANILKQVCLSLGADAGVHRGAINCSIEQGEVLITATQAQLEQLIQKLQSQPFGLKELSESATRMLQRQKRLQEIPIQAMAILNITPDSFSDGGRLNTVEAAVAQAERALDLGVSILDVGGESTRPGAQMVSLKEELERVVPVVKALHRQFPEARISVDTRKAIVAEGALDVGAWMINDVSGLTFDSGMRSVVARYECPIVLMHSQGLPETMQQNPVYRDLIGEITAFFYRQVAHAIEAGVQPDRIILDPGFGFGKSLAHNLELMHRLEELVSIGFPVLIGTSRKSFLTLGRPDIPVGEREALMAASLAMAVQAGARILRIHDPETQMPVIRWLEKVTLAGNSSVSENSAAS